MCERNSWGRLLYYRTWKYEWCFSFLGKTSSETRDWTACDMRNQYTYMWVTYLCLSFLAHMNGETSLLNFLLDLPSSLFHQHTTLKTTQICTITQRAQLAKRKLQITGTLPNTMASLFPSLRLALIIPTIYDAWFLTSWQKWKPCCTYCFSNQQAGTCNSQIGFRFKTPPSLLPLKTVNSGIPQLYKNTSGSSINHATLHYCCCRSLSVWPLIYASTQIPPQKQLKRN